MFVKCTLTVRCLLRGAKTFLKFIYSYHESFGENILTGLANSIFQFRSIFSYLVTGSGCAQESLSSLLGLDF